jgi:hypothetical protein
LYEDDFLWENGMYKMRRKRSQTSKKEKANMPKIKLFLSGSN